MARRVNDAATCDMSPKIGILGGTFDPIHKAHVHCAKEACDALELDKVVFVPAALPSFKRDKDLAPFEQRLEMCELATRDFEKFEVSDIEGRRDGISYTVDTVRELLESDYASARLYFIIGSDAFLTLPKWRESKELASLVDFAVLMRSDDDAESVMDVARELGARAHLVNGERMDVSSSLIREILQEGASPKGFLDDAVLDYIEKEGLYHV